MFCWDLNKGILLAASTLIDESRVSPVVLEVASDYLLFAVSCRIHFLILAGGRMEDIDAKMNDFLCFRR